LPAIRQLQRTIWDRLWPKTPTTSSYYQNNTVETIGSGGKKSAGSRVTKSRIWLPKTDRSQLSTLGGLSKADKDDFVRLDEYEMGVGVNTKNGVIDERVAYPDFPDRSLGHSFNSNDDVIPLATAASPIGSPTGGIMVHSEYSVDRAITNPRLPRITSDERVLMDTQRWV
jgi:hypothetical protein